MNDIPETPNDAELPTSEAAAPSPEVRKPARKSRAAKIVEAPAEADPGAVLVEAPEAAAVKPRRRRAASVAPPESGTELAPEAATSERTDIALEASPVPVSSAPHAVLVPAAQAVEAMGAAPLAEADAGTVSSAPAAGADEARESPRSRRRGRRERRREEGAAGAELAPGAALEGPGDADDADGERDGEEAGLAEPAAPALPPPQAGEVFAQVLSGEFDVEEPVETTPTPAGPPKRVLLPDADAPKLHKVLAQAGVGSRRDMEELILDGQITVNGQPAHIGQRISFGDQIKVAGKPVKVRITPPPPRIIAYHKPVGEVVTHDDPQHRPTVFRRLPRLQQGKWQSVGRLDINTEGLLLFTNSGELANQLMHPRFGVEREYAVRVLGMLTPDDRDELLEGVDIDGQKASFQSIEDGGGEGANHWYRVVINEGRNREVRKLFDTQDLTVSRLIRIRYGTVVLPRGLKRGVWVDLEDADVRAIRRLTLGEGARRDNGPNARGPDRAGGPNKQRNDRQGGRQQRRC